MSRTGIPPRASTVIGRFPCMGFGESSFHQLSGAGTSPLPLAPYDTAKFPPYPAVQLFEDVFHFTQTKVIDPSPELLVQLLDYSC